VFNDFLESLTKHGWPEADRLKVHQQVLEEMKRRRQNGGWRGGEPRQSRSSAFQKPASAPFAPSTLNHVPGGLCSLGLSLRGRIRGRLLSSLARSKLSSMCDPDSWSVQFRGGIVAGPVQAVTNSDCLAGVAGRIVSNALEHGVGDSGDLVDGGLLKQRYHYEVVAIDHDKRVVTVQLEP
jgi:hypothetical protein